MENGGTEDDPGPSEASQARRDVRSVLAVLRETVLELAAGLPQPPSAVRIRTGEASIDVEWAHSGVSLPAEVAAPAGVPARKGEQADRTYVRAPTVGTFFRAPEPGAEPFVDVGDTVTVGQQVAIVETMKLMIPVKADVAGRVLEVLKENGAAVEYEEPLFAVAPSSL